MAATDSCYGYSGPVARLISLGETTIGERRDYLALGLTQAHVPDLLRVLKDMELYSALWDENNNAPPEVYAQVHAWRALTQLKAPEAIPAFLDLLYLIDEEDDDYIGEEIPLMLGEFGEAAIAPCWEYLLTPSHGLYARVAAAYALSEIGQKHPEARQACASALVSVLENFRMNDETLNGFLIAYLIDLKAVEYLDTIERAFAADAVDAFIVGDLEDVKKALGA